MRKLISILLCISMLSSFAVVAHAADNPAGTTIADNPEGTVIGENKGTVTVNNGTVETNKGTIDTNEGTVVANEIGATVYINEGIVEVNEYHVNVNNGTVTKNNCEVGVNHGTVEENTDYVMYNFGIVERVLDDSSVSKNLGTVGVSRDDIDEDNPAEYVEEAGIVYKQLGTVTYKGYQDSTDALFNGRDVVNQYAVILLRAEGMIDYGMGGDIIDVVTDYYVKAEAEYEAHKPFKSVQVLTDKDGNILNNLAPKGDAAYGKTVSEAALFGEYGIDEILVDEMAQMALYAKLAETMGDEAANAKMEELGENGFQGYTLVITDQNGSRYTLDSTLSKLNNPLYLRAIWELIASNRGTAYVVTPVTKGNTVTLTMKVCLYSDSELANKEITVKVNGEVVDADCYTLTVDEAGNIVIVFTDAFLKTLNAEDVNIASFKFANGVVMQTILEG